MAKKAKMTLEKLATIMVEGFEEVKADIGEMKGDIKELRKNVVEIKIDLKAHGRAIDKDAVTLISHDSRIKKLEHSH